MPSLLGAWRAFWAGRAWDDRHRRLLALAPLAGWHRDDIRALVAHGDEVAVTAGEPLLAEDHIGYWFVLVMEGSLAVIRGGRRVGTLGPGAHAGEVAILGFGPQPATVVAATDSRVFVMGRRELLSMADRNRRMQRLLFPDVDGDEFRPFLRALRQEGTAAWKRLPPPVQERASRGPSGLLPPRPGRVVSDPGSFARLAATAFRRPARTPVPMSRRPPLPARSIAVLSAAVVAIAVLSAAMFHPPMVVVSAAAPVDVTGDVSVAGTVPGPISGRFVLTAVDLRQPSLLGATWARVRGDRILTLTGDSNATAAEGRSAFADSQHRAIAAAAAAVNADASGVDVRDRTLQGPSAALVYALVVADLLSEDDLARGRTIAATGTLDAEGRVGPVGFTAEKVAAARAAKAELFVVPAGQGWPTAVGRMRIVAVGSLSDALDALRSPSPPPG